MRIALALLLTLTTAATYAIECETSDINVSHRRLLGPAENVCERYGGNVLLITNVASHCGFTPQYKGLEALYQKYKERGLVVLGFPSADFGDQEFAEESDIANFCAVNFGVSFPMFGKSSVKGETANPLFQQLAARTGQAPRWNFSKYLVARNGKVIAHYDSKVTPDDDTLLRAIEAELSRSIR